MYRYTKFGMASHCGQEHADADEIPAVGAGRGSMMRTSTLVFLGSM